MLVLFVFFVLYRVFKCVNVLVIEVGCFLKEAYFFIFLRKLRVRLINHGGDEPVDGHVECLCKFINGIELWAG